MFESAENIQDEGDAEENGKQIPERSRSGIMVKVCVGIRVRVKQTILSSHSCAKAAQMGTISYRLIAPLRAVLVLYCIVYHFHAQSDHFDIDLVCTAQ